MKNSLVFVSLTMAVVVIASQLLISDKMLAQQIDQGTLEYESRILPKSKE
jgi:hypothetical protein